MDLFLQLFNRCIQGIEKLQPFWSNSRIYLEIENYTNIVSHM